MVLIIIGIVLIVLQILSYIGNIYAGGLTFFTTFSLSEVVYFLSYNVFGIIGVILLSFGIRSKLKKSEETSTMHDEMATWEFTYSFDGSEWFEWEADITPEEATIINDAISKKELLNDIPALSGLLQRVYCEIQASRDYDTEKLTVNIQEPSEETDTDIQNTETISKTANEIANEPITSETHKESSLKQNRTIFGKICSFLLLHKKKVFISTIISAGSIFASLIGFEYATTDFLEDFFESCASVFLILTMVCSFISLIILCIILAQTLKKIIHLKPRCVSSDATPQKNKFCKYCGSKIDEDSIFCSSCGQKLV